ncbi:PglD-related sugar-binding protein [Flavobacterium aciduliphilum]|uniref:Sugar O-acyltransferase (Sialic acid O-acetyltransferase NeuD family) n=1 Tax=Flavobacterium aciduliphilum TaxID=1101402 RepID=A0A328Y878_9FLAO|nr:serine acetyltransferase [Flavobacterium aciduliphilum]RAR70238.1 sugar O-acyltransferase (sialic acid O-acetyltransferase NeuD family) [Flavobacterium aciduliphilum]
MKDIVIYGCGGFGKEIACLINAINRNTPTWNILGFIDDGLEVGYKNRYGAVIGGVDFLNNYQNDLAVAIAIANPKIIDAIVKKINNKNISFPNIIAPNVNFFDEYSFEIGRGNIIFFGCRISCDVKLGDFNLFNGQVALGHDVILGNNNILGPSTRISGDVVVGDNNFFGVESVVLQGNKIGNNTRIGAGSIVCRNTKDNQLYHGNPAKIFKI